jgi:NADPH:quinone reductase-like Zn-dependent oxidoreductase
MARLAMGRSRPRARIRGRDFAGRVEAVGARVRQVRPGDAVFGDLGRSRRT